MPFGLLALRDFYHTIYSDFQYYVFECTSFQQQKHVTSYALNYTLVVVHVYCNSMTKLGI